MKKFLIICLILVGLCASSFSQFKFSAFKVGYDFEWGKSKLKWNSNYNNSEIDLRFTLESEGVQSALILKNQHNVQLEFAWYNQKMTMRDSSVSLANNLCGNAFVIGVGSDNPLKDFPQLGVVLAADVGVIKVTSQKLHPIFVQYQTPTGLDANWYGGLVSLRFAGYWKSLLTGLKLLTSAELSYSYQNFNKARFANPEEKITASGKLKYRSIGFAFALQWDIPFKKDDYKDYE